MAKFQMIVVIRPGECSGFAKFNPPIPVNMMWKFEECRCPLMGTEIDRGHGYDCGCTLEHTCTFNAGTHTSRECECGGHRVNHCPFGTGEREFPMGEVEIPDADLEIYEYGMVKP